MPAVSPDGKWRWTGAVWARVARRPTPRWIIRDGLVWLTLFLAWVPVVAARRPSITAPGAIVVALGSANVLGTLIFGGLLGRNGRWREIWLAAGIGTACLAAAYVVLMVTASDPYNLSDASAGEGLLILGLPTLLLVTALLAAGGGIGRLTRKLRRTAPHRTSATP
jgi:hypothetical protein